MRLFRLATVLLALPLVAAAPADAVPKRKGKPGCGVADPRGDAGPLGSGNLDIVGADAGMGGDQLVALLCVAGADGWAGEPAGGARWVLGASGNGIRYTFELRRGAGGAPASAVTVGGTAVAHTFRLDGTRLVWRVQRRNAPALARPKVVWGDLRAATYAGPVEADTVSARRRG